MNRECPPPIRCLLTICLVLAVSSLTSATHAQDPASLNEARLIAERLTAAQTDPLEHALRLVAAARSADERTARSTQGDESTQRYVEGLEALRAFPRPETLPALHEGLLHHHESVRLAALRALREGASTGREASPALLQARELLLSDPDARVRRAAFEAYCRWGAEGDVLALAQALGREPGPVRDLALREWIRIETERLDR